MELKDQVCSLESAKKLKELGVKQESLFYWSKVIGASNCPWKIYYGKSQNTEIVSAFTVSELGELLPSALKFLGGKQMVLVIGQPFNWQVSYRNEEVGYPIITSADTEAEARAKMLIYLIENKLIEAGGQ